MKKCLLFLYLMIISLVTVTAQTPAYFKGTGTSSNSIPMNSAATLCQQLYLPTDFGTQPPSGLITKIYFRNSVAGASGTYSNFKVAFIQNNLTAFSGTGFLPGAVTALAAPTYTVTGNATAGGWYEIPLATPFLYDGSQTLIVEISYASKTGGISGYTTTATGNKRLSNISSNTAATGTLSTSWGDFGMEVSPVSSCQNPPLPGTAIVTPSSGLCMGNTLSFSLNGNSTGGGQTYEWESSPTSSPFVPTSLGAPAAVPNFSAPATSTSWYRAKIVCSGNAPVYTAPVQVLVNPAFPGGTYTINNTLPTGGTNFNSFAEAIAALNCGIAGPVVFNVSPGTPYTETVTIGNISGTSPVNTIRFKGNGATVQFANTSTNRQMLTLSGAKYISIDSLIFKTLAPDYGWAALITQGAAWDSISRCTFDLTSITSTGSGNSNGICFSASATSPIGAGTNGSHCYIGYNLLKGSDSAGGPYYAIPIVGASDSNVIAHNEIRNFYFYGFYINAASGTIVTGNDINRATKMNVSTFYGIYTTGTIPGTVLSGNRLHDPVSPASSAAAGFNGLYLLGGGTAASPCMVYNNALYNINTSGTSYGIYVNSTSYIQALHNTVNMDKVLPGTSANCGIYVAGANAGVVVKNNIVSITAGSGGSKYGFYYGVASSIAESRHNNFYVNSTQPGVQYYGYYTTPYTTQAAFQAAYPSLETGVPAADPQFINPAAGDLVPGNYALFGTGENLSATVATDLQGNARPIAPTAGAFEIPAAGINNAGTVSLVTPSGSFCPGQQAVSIIVNNAGSNNINTLQVHWMVNGVAQPPVTTTDMLVPVSNPNGKHMDTLTLGLTTFAPGMPATIKAWTYMPNNAADVENLNDTLVVTIQPAAFDIVARQDTICAGTHASLSLLPATGYSVGQLLWQQSGNGSGWTDLANTDTIHYRSTSLGGDTWFRVKISNGANICYSNVAKIAVADPQILGVADTSNCGPGQLTLRATASANAVVKWYASAGAIQPIATGNSFTTPLIGASTTYFVAADIARAQPQPIFAGSGTSTTATSYSPFYASYQGQKAQYLVKASELLALGFNAGLITSLGFDVAATTTIVPLSGFTVKLKAGTISELTTAWETGMTTVFSTPAYTITPLSVNQFILPVPFPWNGTDDIVIETCYQNAAPPAGTTAIRYSAGFNFDAAHYQYSNAANNCDTPGAGFTIASRPNIQFGMRSSCESPRQAVVAQVYPGPVVNLGPDTAICAAPEQTAILDAGNPGAAYAWDNAATGQTRVINTSGTFHVTVTDSLGCSRSDTITINLLPSPLVRLGNDTNVCEGIQLLLDAGNPGMDHFWNTGVTGQQLMIDDAGSYSVIVTSAEGCTALDTINVTMNGQLPAHDGISINNNGLLTYVFSAIDPVNVVAYLWDFGDGSPRVTDPAPVHTYAAQGTYTVRLELFSNCGSTVDIQPANIVGIGKIAVDPAEVSLYPNPGKENVAILNKSTLKMESVTVSNVLGQVVYHAEAGSARRHQFSVAHFGPGLYQVAIKTDKGIIVRKLQVTR